MSLSGRTRRQVGQSGGRASGPAPGPVDDPVYMSRKFESFERINSIRETNGNFDSCNSCKRLVLTRRDSMSQNFRLFHVSNLSVRNFELFCSCIRPCRPFRPPATSTAGSTTNYSEKPADPPRASTLRAREQAPSVAWHA